MRTETTQGDTFHNVFLAGNFVLAGVDVTGLLEYGLRIAVGAVVLSGLAGVRKYIVSRMKKKQAETRLNRTRNRKSKKAAHGITE
jgi:hypothetical protein